MRAYSIFSGESPGSDFIYRRKSSLGSAEGVRHSTLFEANLSGKWTEFAHNRTYHTFSLEAGFRNQLLFCADKEPGIDAKCR